MTLAARALEIALSHQNEAEIQGRPNEGPIVEWSIGEWTRREPGPWARWCAAFVSTCYLHAEREQEPAAAPRWHGIGSTSCTRLLQRCRDHGFFFTLDLTQAAPGDLLFFREPQPAAPGPLPEAEPPPAASEAVVSVQHVGLVVQQSGSSLLTIEGNAGNAVRRRTYHTSFFKLFGLVRCPF